VVNACLLLRQAGFELKLHLVGSIEGPGKQMLLDTVKECDPNSEFVTISNHINSEFLPHILFNADIFVFASSCENMPNSLVEGMASGLPIACSERGPMPEVLGDAGTYFDPENILSIVDALRHLITSEDVRNDLSEKAYKRALNFSWEKCASETVAYLCEVFEMSTVGKNNQ
jgi:glycosyltransferase involved in cell wall biosynthesis